MGLSAMAGGLLPPWLRRQALAAAGQPGKPRWPDLVAVRDGSPADMFDAGIAALGGLRRFVKKGQTVLIKPNIGWDKTPPEAADTNPDLVGRVVAAAKAAGAARVICFDHTVNVERACYQHSGIADAVKRNGGEMRSGGDRRDYRPVAVPGARVLKEVLVHKLYLDCDVVINVPILKSVCGGRVTASLKNLMGVVWDRQYWHGEHLHRCIAEFPRLRRPDLNVVDAYRILIEHGFYGTGARDILVKKMQILSADPVLADSAGVRILGRRPDRIPYLKIAAGLGVGRIDLERAEIKRIVLKA
ncbi:MAG: DUF362 domain-containing protein [Elusimicrobia bacterium]|nr:DUF362 domain-containing protein [Elusimicrobiota bacterium]